MEGGLVGEVCGEGVSGVWIWDRSEGGEGERGKVLLAFTSASLRRRRSTSSSGSLRLTAIMRGVHPEPSCAKVISVV